MVDRLQQAGAPQVAWVPAGPGKDVYVGPRPFERDERDLFFGRDREISELLSLVISSRVVLCYAPSGAGKTSLVNAGLGPRLEQEGFETLPSARVGGQTPAEIDRETIPNLYAFNALLSLAGKGGVASQLAEISLAGFLATRPHAQDREGFPAPRILIFDQFEELLTSYPERWQEREGFFQQVQAALQADPLLRALFLIREDFLARIEPFMRLLKPFQQARFRLALLDKEGACAAITGPLRGTGRRFKEGVADALVAELRKVRVETAQGQPLEVVGEYVEPVQLQVVCRNLWRGLPADVEEISAEHLEAYGDVDHALQDFYESCLAKARARLDAQEPLLRRWFEQQLVTPAGTRGIVFRDAARTADLPNPVVDFLEDQHLIRGEWRAGSRWYELTHDRFIEPIQRSNARWRARRQARKNRWVVAGATPLLLGLVLLAFSLGNRQNATIQAIGSATAVARQATSYVQGQATQISAKEALSNSRQLASQALLADDPDLALLLAVEANKQADTPEARRSLQKILSRESGILSEFDPQLLSPGLVRRFEGHINWVQSVAFSPDGRQMVSGSNDTKVRIWNVFTGKYVELEGHGGEVWSVAYSPTSDWIASSGIDGNILLWDAAAKEPVALPLLDQDAWITSLAFSPDGRRLAAGDLDGTLRVWDVPARELQESRAAHRGMVGSVAWSPDGRFLASGGVDGMIRLWDSASFRVENLMASQSGQVRSLAWSPDSRRLASGMVLETGKQDSGGVMLWNVETGEATVRSLLEAGEPIKAVAFDPSGTILAIGRQNGTILFWNARSEQFQGEALKAHEKAILSMAFSPDGRYLLSGSIDKTIALWDLFAPARAVAFSPGYDAFAAGQGALISLWDPRDPALPLAILPGHAQDVLALAFSPDGSILASSGMDGEIRLWDVATREQVGQPLQGHSGEVYALDFDQEGATLLSAGQDGNVNLWDPMGSLLVQSLYNLVQPLYSQDSPVISALFGPDEKLFLGGRDGSLATVDLAAGEGRVEMIPSLQGQSLACLAISPDGQRVAFSRETGIPSVEDGERAQGIELSEWSKDFNPDGSPGDIDFVVLLATNGLEPDYSFAYFLDQVQSVPVRGASHLFQFDRSWQAQAEAFLSAVKDRGFHFFTLMFDWGTVAEGSGEQAVQNAGQWLKYVDERVDQKILLEISPGNYDTWLSPEGDWSKWPLFLIGESLQPDPNGNPLLPTGVNDWKMWQYSADNNLGWKYGIGSQSATLSVYNGTLTEMWEWLETPVFSLYDRSSGQQLNPGGLARVASPNGIAFSPDGAYVAVGGEHLVFVADAGLGNEVTSLDINWTTVTSLGFSPDGLMLAIGTEGGTVLLWDLGLLYPDTGREYYLEIACSFVKRDARDFTDSELIQYFGNTTQRHTCPNPQ